MTTRYGICLGKYIVHIVRQGQLSPLEVVVFRQISFSRDKYEAVRNLCSSIHPQSILRHSVLLFTGEKLEMVSYSSDASHIFGLTVGSHDCEGLM